MIINVNNNENLSGNYGSGTVINCPGHLIVSGSISSGCVIYAQTILISGSVNSGAVFNASNVTISGNVSSGCAVNGNLVVSHAGSVGSGCRINGNLDVSGSVGSGCSIGGNLILSGNMGSGCSIQGDFHMTDSASIGSGLKCRGRRTGAAVSSEPRQSAASFTTAGNTFTFMGGYNATGTSGRQSSTPVLVSFHYRRSMNYNCIMRETENGPSFEFGYKGFSINMTVSRITGHLDFAGEHISIDGQPFIEFIRQFESSNAHVAQFLKEFKQQASSQFQPPPSPPQSQRSNVLWKLLRDLGVKATDVRPEKLDIKYIEAIYKKRVVIVHPDKNLQADQIQVNNLLTQAIAAKDILIRDHLGETIPTLPHGYIDPEMPRQAPVQARRATK